MNWRSVDFMLADLEHKRRREISMSAGRRESRAPGDNGHGDAHGSPGLRANRDGVFQKLERGAPCREPRCPKSGFRQIFREDQQPHGQGTVRRFRGEITRRAGQLSRSGAERQRARKRIDQSFLVYHGEFIG
jgi:hypothetical protein